VRRRAVNEDALVEALARRGYARVVPSALDVSAHAALFAGAKHMVAPHGAGLANLVFMFNGRQAVEPFAPSYGVPSFYVLAAGHRIPYATYVVKDCIAGPRPQTDDLLVDVADFEAVAGICCERARHVAALHNCRSSLRCLGECLMRIGIIGRHPIPQPGFCGVLSLYEAIWFANMGDRVTLFLPFENRTQFAGFKVRHLLTSLDGLEKFGGNFAIEPVFLDDPKLPSQDVYIWQSTKANEWDVLSKFARENSSVLTKNFPKAIPAWPESLNKGVIMMFRAYDYVALALREDLETLRGEPEFYDSVRHRVGYVPRGADPVLLHPGGKSGTRPVIGLDTPNTDDYRAIEHYHEPLNRLRARYPDLEVLSLGRPTGLSWSTTVRFGRFDRIYDAFFNRIWMYLTIDYGHSPQHIRARIQQLEPELWGRKAVYEVQNIEAQMSGAVLVGHPVNLIPELFEPDGTGILFSDFNDADEITSRLGGIIERYPAHRDRARAWALERHTWERCIGLWREGLAQLVLNGYRRRPPSRVALGPARA
jgi:glycosyltransferase involved in cell wall biosynthesis